MKTFLTVASMKLARLNAGQLVSTQGYYAAGDGGQATYLIKAPQAFDGYGDHELANSNIAVLQVEGIPDLKQYGAKVDNSTDDTASITAAEAVSGITELFIPEGTTLVTSYTLTKTYRGPGFISVDGVIQAQNRDWENGVSADSTEEYSRVLDNWQIRNTPKDDGYLSVAWSPELELFAAVAGTGATYSVITSPNGVDWTERTLPLSQQWVEVVWASGPAVFVAVAISGTTQRVMTSADGITWTARTTPNNDYRGLCWSPDVGDPTDGRLLAVSTAKAGTTVITSDDGGVTWDSRSYAFADEEWVSCVWSPGLSLFVVTAVNTINGPIMTSPDGITWTRRDNGAATTHAGENWQAVEWSPELELLVVVTNTGTAQRAYTSTDGINWTVRTTPTIDGFNPSYHDVIWVPEIHNFVACANTGDPGQVMSSYDGIDWILRQTPQSSSWEGLAYSPEKGIIVAVADNTQPTPTGNHIITASLADLALKAPPLLYMDRQILRKQLSLQAVNNSTVLVASDGLAQNFEAGDTVHGYVTLRFDSAIAADFKVTIDEISGTGAITGTFGVVGNAAFNTAGTWARQGPVNVGTTISVAGNGAAGWNTLSLWFKFAVTGGRTFVGVKFAQDTADVSDTRLTTESFMTFMQSAT